MAHLRSRAPASAADGALFWVAASEVQALVGADKDEAWQLSEQIIGCLLATGGGCNDRHDHPGALAAARRDVREPPASAGARSGRTETTSS
jgi:hypothetical protein